MLQSKILKIKVSYFVPHEGTTFLLPIKDFYLHFTAFSMHLNMLLLIANCLPETYLHFTHHSLEKKMKNETIKRKNCIFHIKNDTNVLLHPMYSVSYSTIYTLWIYIQFHTFTKNRIVHYATATLIKRWATMGLSNVILKLSRTISEGMPFFFIRL